MPTMFVVFPQFGKPELPFDLLKGNPITRDLRLAEVGTYSICGGNEGYELVGYLVKDPDTAKMAAIASIEKHLPEREYWIRLSTSENSATAFNEVMEEFYHLYRLQRDDKQPFGTMEYVQQLLLEFFPKIQFHWSRTGSEFLQFLESKGVTPSPIMQRVCPSSPSSFGGVFETMDYRVEFGLGHQDPVTSIGASWFGDSLELQTNLARMDDKLGTRFQPVKLRSR